MPSWLEGAHHYSKSNGDMLIRCGNLGNSFQVVALWEYHFKGVAIGGKFHNKCITKRKVAIVQLDIVHVSRHLAIVLISHLLICKVKKHGVR